MSNKLFLCQFLWLMTIYSVECYSLETLLEMPITDVEKTDEYICASFLLDNIEEGYYVSMNFTVDDTQIHHMSTGVCEEPVSFEKSWRCAKTQGANCKGAAVNLGGWDQFTTDKGKLILPEGISVKVGSQTKLKYFVMEVHYRNILKASEQNKPSASITLQLTDKSSALHYQMYQLTNSGYIPANRPEGHFSETACEWTRPPVKMYKYSGHTHHHGVLAEAFLVRNKTWTFLGSLKSHMKTKDSYHIPGGPIEVRPGDILAGRCLFINNESTKISFGLKDAQEMCSFELQLGIDPNVYDHFPRPLSCSSKSPKFSFCDFQDRLDFC